jgi:TonB family protein
MGVRIKSTVRYDISERRESEKIPMKAITLTTIILLFLHSLIWSEQNGIAGVGFGKKKVSKEQTKKLNQWIDSIEVLDSIRIAHCLLIPDSTCKRKGLRNKGKTIRTVSNNLESLRLKYNEILRKQPDAKGRILVKMKVVSSGKVIESKIENSNFPIAELDSFIIEKIKKWDFGPIGIQNDTTEILYPFNFTR